MASVSRRVRRAQVSNTKDKTWGKMRVRQTKTAYIRFCLEQAIGRKVTTQSE